MLAREKPNVALFYKVLSMAEKHAKDYIEKEETLELFNSFCLEMLACVESMRDKIKEYLEKTKVHFHAESR